MAYQNIYKRVISERLASPPMTISQPGQMNKDNKEYRATYVSRQDVPSGNLWYLLPILAMFAIVLSILNSRETDRLVNQINETAMTTAVAQKMELDTCKTVKTTLFVDSPTLNTQGVGNFVYECMYEFEPPLNSKFAAAWCKIKEAPDSITLINYDRSIQVCASLQDVQVQGAESIFENYGIQRSQAQVPSMWTIDMKDHKRYSVCGLRKGQRVMVVGTFWNEKSYLSLRGINYARNSPTRYWTTAIIKPLP